MLIQIEICVWRLVVFASSLLAEEVVETFLGQYAVWWVFYFSISFIFIVNYQTGFLNAQPVLSGQLPIPKV